MNLLPPESGKYLGVGVTLAASFLFFMFLGYQADKFFKKFPALTIVGSLFGLGIGFYNLFMQINSVRRDRK